MNAEDLFEIFTLMHAWKANEIDERSWFLEAQILYGFRPLCVHICAYWYLHIYTHTSLIYIYIYILTLSPTYTSISLTLIPKFHSRCHLLMHNILDSYIVFSLLKRQCTHSYTHTFLRHTPITYAYIHISLMVDLYLMHTPTLHSRMHPHLTHAWIYISFTLHPHLTHISIYITLMHTPTFH